MNLKEWAEKFNNMEYGSNNIRDAQDELEADGVIAVMGASDDLCELYGDISDEFNCYNGNKLYWVGNGFCSETEKDNFLCVVDNEYPIFFEKCQAIFNKDCSYINIKEGTNCQFEYETNIPCERFNVMEDGNLYCSGLLFYTKDLIG